MGGTLEALRTVFAPAAFALIVFLLFTHVFIPTWRENREASNHYLISETSMGRPNASVPVAVKIVNATSRLISAVGSLFSAAGRLAAAQRERLMYYRDQLDPSVSVRPTRHTDDGWLSEGEDPVDHQRGEELGPVRHDVARGNAGYETGRLSRDLEQGFMDDSDDDDYDDRRR